MKYTLNIFTLTKNRIRSLISINKNVRRTGLVNVLPVDKGFLFKKQTNKNISKKKQKKNKEKLKYLCRVIISVNCVF